MAGFQLSINGRFWVSTEDTISNEQVRRLKLRLHDKSPKTINNVLSVLNVLLKQAVEWSVLDKIPCSIRLGGFRELMRPSTASSVC